MKEMYMYMTITQRDDAVIQVALLNKNFIGDIDPSLLKADHILALVQHLGYDGWVCIPLGNEVRAFWCYRAFMDWEDEKQLVKDIAALTLERIYTGQ